VNAKALALFVAACGSAPAPPAKSLQLNRAGEQVDVGAALVLDYITIVDFWSASCAACAIVGGKVAEQVANEPRVVLRKVDVGDGFTPVARTYQIGALPHLNVYDRKRRLRYILVGNDCLRAPALARELLAE